MWPFNTDDCLIEVTTWAGLTIDQREKNFPQRLKSLYLKNIQVELRIFSSNTK